jgi:putative ABC transport system permease protein
MNLLTLVWSTLWHRRLRTTLTLLSIVAAFLLYGVLATVDSKFSHPVADRGAARLITVSRYSMGLPLPMAALQTIAAVPGVRDASPLAVIGAYYREPADVVPTVAIDPASYFSVNADASVEPAALQAFEARRDSALAGADLARRHGWKVGDRITLHSTTSMREDGSQDWSFEIAGLMDGKDAATRSAHASGMLVRLDYYDSARAFGKGTVSWFTEAAADPAQAGAVASRIDAAFANSDNETSSRSAKEFALLYLRQIGDIGLIIRTVLGAVFFTLLLLTANTMREAVRERTRDMAVLKAIGFRGGTVMGLVVAEALLLCLAAAAIGLGLAYLALPAIKASLSGLDLPARALLPGFGFAVALALVSSVQPGLRALRLRIADALSDKR